MMSQVLTSKTLMLYYLIVTVTITLSACSSTQATPTEEALLKPGLPRTRAIDGMQTLYVLAGTFKMGSEPNEIDDALELCLTYDTNCSRRYFAVEGPKHTVTLDAFWIDQTEVTQSQYHRCIEAGECDDPACWEPDMAEGLQYPVVCVTWAQASSYCRWVGGRLPTEAEWEYAARGPDAPLFPWGDTFEGQRLNYCDSNCTLSKRDVSTIDGYALSAPVGNYPSGASWIGALDMAGNVWELVSDWKGDYPADPQINPTGAESGLRRLARGGSWHASPDHARSAVRTNIGPHDSSNHIGFRCVMPA